MNQATYNKIIVVDEHDENPRAVSYHDAINNGWIRRAARIFVFSESNKVLIQKRSAHVNKPLLLDPSVGGHVDEGETYLQAATRELKEELGLDSKDYSLKKVTEPYLSDGFYSVMYKLTVPDDVQIDFDTKEVAEVMWVTLDELDSMVATRANECTQSLIGSWTLLRDKLIAT